METKAAVVTVIGLTLAAVVVCAPVACTMNRQQIIATAIKDGGDPIAVKCAIESNDNSYGQSSAMCLAKALEGVRK